MQDNRNAEHYHDPTAAEAIKRCLENVRVTIIGEPCGKGRPRFARNGATYTPQKTVNYETLVQVEYRVQTACKRFEGPVKMTITAYYGIPKSAPKQRKSLMEMNRVRPIKKPDIDNVAKIICDALNGYAYHDDTQVVELRAVKLYGDPRVVVEIEEVTP